jgi:histidinol-phosphatase (PHP family)
MGDYNAVRIRKGNKSITVSNETPKDSGTRVKGLFSRHLDKPGVLSSLFNSLASEGVNVETARLHSNNDGTAVAFLTLGMDNGNVENAIDFVKGTDQGTFLDLSFDKNTELPNFYGEGVYLYEMDGVELKIALSDKIILTKHENSPGVLLILLSALASIHVNIIDLRLGKRNKIGYSALAVDGDSNQIRALLGKLGEQYYEAHLVEFFSM